MSIRKIFAIFCTAFDLRKGAGLLIGVFLSYGAAGQNGTLPDGTWLISSNASSPYIEDPYLSGYRRFEFRGNFYHLGTNPIERGIQRPMSLRDSTLVLAGQRFAFSQPSDHEIILAGRSGDKTTLVRQSYFDSLRNSIEILPEFLGNFYLHTYIFSRATKPAGFRSDFAAIMETRMRSYSKDDSLI